MRRYEILIFVTGSVTLSLEVLASRIMTPYFGVSLYIWSGILSITLTFLAIGYHYGGRISRQLVGNSLEYAFLAAPIVSAASIGISAAVYPIVLPVLAQTNLILGSFIGASLLLSLPLIALSAMNPLLIGIQRDKRDKGDGGAGRVFFISTVGSVAGVVMTAFLFIPNVTNYRAILALGIAICIVTAVFAGMSTVLSFPQKRKIYACSLMASIFCGALLIGKNSYLKFVSEFSTGQLVFDVRAEYTSMFGNITVADARRRDGIGKIHRYFLQDGFVQNRTTLDNVSVSTYTYVLESLAHSFAPDARDIVVLGLGAGIVPRHLKRDGLNVSVVEINPKALKAATTNFGFDQSGIQIHLVDARTFVRRCKDSFDVAIVDLFSGDNIPDYLLTKEFFRDLRNCIRSGGSVVMNSFFDSENTEPNRRLLATIATSFPRMFLSGILGGNAFIVGTLGVAPKNIVAESPNMPTEVAELVNFTMSHFEPVSPTVYQYSWPVSDEQNVFSVLFSDANMAYRQYLAGFLPPNVLVN